MNRYLLIYKHLRFVVFLSLISIFFVSNQTLTSAKEIDNLDFINYKVEFIKSFSSSKNFPKETGLFKKFTNLIFGEDEFNLVRPNYIIAKDSTHLFILDYGLLLPLEIDFLNSEIHLKDGGSINAFPSLVEMCFGDNGRVYFTDSKLNKLYYFDENDESPKILNDSLVLKQPTGIAFSKINKEIIVSETTEHRLKFLDEKGNLKKIIGKRGNENVQFNYPTYIWIDDFGKIYVNDAMNFRIQILNKDGDFLKTFGEQGDASGYFASSKGIATDTFGHIYVVDALFHTVQVFDIDGNYLYKFGNRGKKDGEFYLPSGIFIDKNNYIYVADSFNSRIQIFQIVKSEKND
jgi:DNA-binding beta-propeller fold protein YncE